MNKINRILSIPRRIYIYGLITKSDQSTRLQSLTGVNEISRSRYGAW